LLELIKAQKRVLFLDEAVFTCRQANTECWWKMGSTEAPQKQVNQLSFQAIAVIAATDV